MESFVGKWEVVAVSTGLCCVMPEDEVGERWWLMVLVRGSVPPVHGLSREQALLREAQALQSRYWQSLILGLCLRADVMEGVQAALARGPASAPPP